MTRAAALRELYAAAAAHRANQRAEQRRGGTRRIQNRRIGRAAVPTVRHHGAARGCRLPPRWRGALVVSAARRREARRVTLVAAALAYAAMGWPVFPLSPQGKTPLIPRHRGGRGFLDATVDHDQIAAWWDRCPIANVGIATGSPFFAVTSTHAMVGMTSSPSSSTCVARCPRRSKPAPAVVDVTCSSPARPAAACWRPGSTSRVSAATSSRRRQSTPTPAGPTCGKRRAGRARFRSLRRRRGCSMRSVHRSARGSTSNASKP